ncbi:MAG: hypothetical protein ACI351_01720 [Candidatus Avelusimicrobium sp.]|uniref:hypothetical protein n=1 Tax=Candidatus Avelusimicrobium sp. TaxID=3048833 RepID=UPI003F12BF26
MAETNQSYEIVSISDLNPIPELSESDKTPVENAAGTYSMTLAQEKEFFNRGMQPKEIPVQTLSSSSGTVTLADGNVYRIRISTATTFVLPAVTDVSVHHQIKVFLSVSGTPAINWGTSHFFGGFAPYVQEGEFVVYFDFVPALNVWVAGAMEAGAL